MFETIESLNRYEGKCSQATQTTDPYATTIRETDTVYSYIVYC